ncbi:MAG: Protein YzbB [uncultured Thermomicrobiales bacterium]|uniref:Protein YzbB n=1 Tax=uncultured Thermomicrobiales bacterium TaxID=1645740 RepID=A0A6J4UB28_9BACT|nr:MAG: Protein YzbB [uncultured Thermomicrobiales bacterium]
MTVPDRTATIGAEDCPDWPAEWAGGGTVTPSSPGAVRTGLDVLLAEGIPGLAGARVGLITNPTGVDRGLRSGIDRLHASDRVSLVALYGPEHGVRGDAQAGARVGAGTDPRTGLPTHSLYGEERRPTVRMLAGLEALLFDVQDVGVRYYTYASTMVLAQEAAAAAGLPFVVLDRPNPLSGSRVEGPTLDLAFASFVGAFPVPVRHGLTVGELARLVAAERGWPEPTVVAMRGWRREQWFDATGLPWVQPSPNLPTLTSVTLYPGTCLVEGTNASEGRGTTRPFEFLGAPWLDPFRLAEDLSARGLPGVAFRPAWFTPTFSKHAGRPCGGVQVHVVDRAALRPVALGLHLLDALRRPDPAAFAWAEGPDGVPFVDRLLGSDGPRRALEAGLGIEEVTEGWAAETRAFVARRRPAILYP